MCVEYLVQYFASKYEIKNETLNLFIVKPSLVIIPPSEHISTLAQCVHKIMAHYYRLVNNIK